MFYHRFSLALMVLCATFASAEESWSKIPACDTGSKDHQYTANGVGYKWQTPDDKVYYLSPGQSACGPSYTDYSNVVCLSTGWINTAKVSSCFNWVQMFNPANGVTAQGYVLDSCDGGDPKSTFGCNDIYVSLGLFKKLAGSQEKQAIDRGDLGGPIQWRFIQEPCWSTYSGLPGKLLNGTTDPAQGPDYEGNLRCGRKRGDERIVGPSVAEVCNRNIKSCDQANKIAATLPKYKGSGQGVAQPNVVAFNAQGNLL